jgi:uncharacterized tellurite resistance protein B-like protein
MINFWTLLGLQDCSVAQREKLGNLFAELEQLLHTYSDEEVKLITGFSGLLGKVAYSDRIIKDEELKEIEKILLESTSLSSSLYEAVLDVVRRNTKELKGLQDYRYLRILNEVCSKEQKMDILQALFAVAAADDEIDFHEDHDLAIIAKGLNLSQQEFTEVRVKFSDKLSVMKNL